MENDATLEVITLFKSSNEAEALSNELRAQGCALHYKNASDLETLFQYCNDFDYHIAIISTQLNDIAKQAVSRLKREFPQLPVIVYTHEYRYEEHAVYIGIGANNYIPDSDESILLWGVEKEKKSMLLDKKLTSLEKKYLDNEIRIRTLMESSRDAIAYIHEGAHVYCNQAYIDILGFSDSSAVEATPILSMIHRSDYDQFKKILRDISNGKRLDEEMEFTISKENGECFSSIMKFTAASFDEEECTQLYIRNNLVNEKELEQIKSHDYLTGLFNSQYFMEKIEIIVGENAKGENKYTDFILYIDIDDFKKTSENLGLVATDQFIGRIGKLLSKLSNDDITVARFSADVFTLLFRNANTKLATSIANNICNGLKKNRFQIGESTINCTCSIGVAQISDTSKNAAHIMSLAESACKVAKTQGKDQYYSYTVEDERAKNSEDQKNVLLIKKGLKEKLFCLLYQPIVSMAGETEIRYEASFSYCKPVDGQPEIKQLLNIANQTGLTVTIELWILKTVLAKISGEKTVSKDRSELFVPISLETVKQGKLMNALLKLALKSNLRFVFEITELEAKNDDGTLVKFATFARKHDCNMAISNVGINNVIDKIADRYYAKYIKVNRELTDSISTSNEAQHSIAALKTLGKSTGFRIIATHIDEASSIANLWSVGIQLIQGNYIQAPDQNLTYDFASSG